MDKGKAPLPLPSEYQLIGSAGPIAAPVTRVREDPPAVDIDAIKAQCIALFTENARLRAENERLQSLIDTMNKK